LSEGRPSHLKLYSLLAFMVFFWSANYVAGKYVLRQIPPLLTVGIRMILAGVIMVPVYKIWSRRNGGVDWTRRDVPLIVTLGLAGIGLNQLFFIVGLSRTSVSHAAVIIGLTPVMVLAIASLSGLERMSIGRLAGMLIALSGVAILQAKSTPGRGYTWVGDLFIFLSALTFSTYTVRAKAAIHRVGGVTMNTFAYVVSAILLLPVTAALGADFDFGAVSARVWACLAFMALIPSVVCYLIYYYALAWIPASRVSTLAYLQPVLATTMAIPTLGEYPTGSLIAGGIVVLAGVFMAERL
jgi:drug/metabolite transporter (DMT)-like permease